MNANAMQILQEGVEELPKQTQPFAKSLVAQYAKKGALSEKQWAWVEKLADDIEYAGVPDFTKEEVMIGDLTGILALFGKAKTKLKYPKIVMMTEDGHKLTLSVAGEKAKHPGSINVTGGGSYANSVWYGRVHTSGKWEPSQLLQEPLGTQIPAALAKLAQDPEKAATSHGKLTGNCCFCNSPLTDKKSVSVGYGKICSQNWGLPWGVDPLDEAVAKIKAKFTAEHVAA